MEPGTRVAIVEPGEGGRPPELPKSRDATPELAEWQEWVVRIVAVGTLLYSTYYVTWRWLETINWGAWWFSIPLALAETYILFSAALLVFTAWKLRRRDPPPAPEGLSVDVFITTYDESIEIIRRTAIAARGISYPHRTYILDDGKRDSLREMADELGIGYIRREGNEHAKAGNLNNALKVTDGEFILQLDADHVPLPHILDRLLGFLDDPEVAFVQSPQDFYNTDSFSYDVNDKAKQLWEEQRIFFSLIQPGKDHWNAAFFCGSCGVLRRSALEEIGGFQTETITEDMETSMVLHARGWKSVYYGESLAYGLAPASAGQYAVQRLRWGQGSMQTMRKYNPLFHKGLSLPQRLCYFDSTVSYLDGPFKLVLYLAPVVFFFTGVLPIWVDEQAFLMRFVPFLVLNLVMFELLFRGTGFLLIAERYNMAKFWIYTLAISGFFARGKLAFNVTPKGEGEVPFQTYAPQLVLAVLTATSVVWATVAYSQGWLDYSAPGWESGAFWFNLLWAVYNFYFAVYVVRISLRYKQQRKDERFQAVLPLLLAVRDAAAGAPDALEAEARLIAAVTCNLNLHGMAFRAPAEIEVGSTIEVVLPLETRDVRVSGKIAHRKQAGSTHSRAGAAGASVYVYGVTFDDISPSDRDAIDLHCTHHAVPVHRRTFQESKQPFQQVVDWLYDPRAEPRRYVSLPAMVRGDGEDGAPEQLGFLLDTSRSGARLVVEHPPTPGTKIGYYVPNTGLSAEGEVTTVRSLKTPIGTRYAVGLHVNPPPRRRWPGGQRVPRPARNGGGVRIQQDSMTHEQRETMRSIVSGIAAIGLFMALAVGAPLSAQGVSVTFVGETAGDDLSLYLAEGTWAAGGMGIGPVASLQTYLVTTDDDGASGSIWSVTPAVGLRYGMDGGFLQGTVGYSLKEQNDGAPTAFFGGAENGVTVSGHLQIWGTGAYGLQGIVSHNFGSDYLWSRGRGTVRLSDSGSGAVHVGAEAGWQGEIGADRPLTGTSAPAYSAVMAGPVVKWSTENLAVALGAGWKGIDTEVAPEGEDSTWYARLEVTVTPRW